MAEPFSHRVSLEGMEDLADDGILDVLRELFETDRVFYGSIRLLERETRNHVVAAQLRNTGLALQLLRTIADRPAQPQSLVMNIDLSGNVLRNFLDPVPVVATQAQITAALETGVDVDHETCPICRDPVQVATRLRACGHSFHGACITEWLGMNTRCPVCRHDIRDPQVQPAYGSQGNPSQ